MSVEGIWTGEILGPYGWENTGVYVLEGDRILGGSNRHYSSGKFSVLGDAYTAEVLVHYYGPPRTIFGDKQEKFNIEVTAKIGDGTMVGQIVRSDKPDAIVEYRMTKRMEIPAR